MTMIRASSRRALRALTLLAAAAWLPATAKAADELRYQFKDAKNPIYEVTLTADTPDVATFGVGHRIGSVVVKSGDWEFCTAPQYGGACITVGPGRDADLPAALHGNLASIRRADTAVMVAARADRQVVGIFLCEQHLAALGALGPQVVGGVAL